MGAELWQSRPEAYAGQPVDVIPYGMGDDEFELGDGYWFDCSGLAEAHEHADHHEVEPGLVIAAPSLARMLVLKLIAWRYRRGHTHKDAWDLADLLDCSHRGIYAEKCWEEEAASRCDWDPELTGPFVQGQVIGAEYGNPTLGKVLEVLDESVREELADRIPSTAQSRKDQLAALREGIVEVTLSA